MSSVVPPRPGPLSLEELRVAVEGGSVDTVVLALVDMQGRLQGKRLHARHFLDEVAEHGTEACNYLLAVDVEMNTVGGYEMSSWERGYGDFVLEPDFSTLRLVPWLEGSALMLADLAWEDGSPVVASPRQVLRAQLERLAERGWTAMVGTELEFLVFEDTYEQRTPRHGRPTQPGDQPAPLRRPHQHRPRPAPTRPPSTSQPAPSRTCCISWRRAPGSLRCRVALVTRLMARCGWRA